MSEKLTNFIKSGMILKINALSVYMSLVHSKASDLFTIPKVKAAFSDFGKSLNPL